MHTANSKFNNEIYCKRIKKILGFCITMQGQETAMSTNFVKFYFKK